MWMKGCRFRISPPYAHKKFEGTITQLFGYPVGTWAMFESVNDKGNRAYGTLAPLHLMHAEHLNGCAVEHHAGAQADQIIIDG